jgi:hypothetical protein
MTPSSFVVRFTMIMWGLLPLLDRGERLDPQETRRQIKGGTILPWLAAQGIDVSFVAGNEVAAREVTDLFQRLESAVGPTQFGVQHNGLAILLAYCTEGIQQTAQREWGTPEI